MAIPHAEPGDVIDVRPLGAALSAARAGKYASAQTGKARRAILMACHCLAYRIARRLSVPSLTSGVATPEGQL